MGGALYAASTRIDWASLLRRSLDVDVLQCPKCQGRLRVLAVITEREPVRRILAHLGVPTDAPPVARARDPTDDLTMSSRRTNSSSGSRDRGAPARRAPRCVYESLNLVRIL